MEFNSPVEQSDVMDGLTGLTSQGAAVLAGVPMCPCSRGQRDPHRGPNRHPGLSPVAPDGTPGLDCLQPRAWMTMDPN